MHYSLYWEIQYIAIIVQAISDSLALVLVSRAMSLNSLEGISFEIYRPRFYQVLRFDPDGEKK